MDIHGRLGVSELKEALEGGIQDLTPTLAIQVGAGLSHVLIIDIVCQFVTPKGIQACLVNLLLIC
jgi:hypothetical protein